jgi:hypothetical protein
VCVTQPNRRVSCIAAGKDDIKSLARHNDSGPGRAAVALVWCSSGRPFHSSFTTTGISSASASIYATGVQLSAASLAENSRDCSRWLCRPLCQPARLPSIETEIVWRTCTLVRTRDAVVARRTSRWHVSALTNLPQRCTIRSQTLADQVSKFWTVRVPLSPSCFFWRSRCCPPRDGVHLLFPQRRTSPLLRVHISDHGLCSLVDMDVLYSDVLVTTVTQAAIRFELRSEGPRKPGSSGRKPADVI